MKLSQLTSGAAVAVIAPALYFSTLATAQGPTPIASVWLQPAIPGSAQIGNMNISGVGKMGSLRVGASSTFGYVLMATDSLGQAQWQPDGLELPYGNTASNQNEACFYVTNLNTSFQSAGIRGTSNSTVGMGFGVVGEGGYVGVEGRTISTGGSGIAPAGVKGYSSSSMGQTYGVFGQNESSAGRGVYGENRGSGIGVYGGSLNGGIGVFGKSHSAGAAAHGGQFEATGGTAIGCLGVNLSTTGAATGGYFISGSPDARALYGLATHATGFNYGTVGQANSTNGIGIWGTSGANGWAVYAQGRFGATGTKSFQIDHPLDPENKYLMHYSSESPEPQNFYNGIAVTDVKCEAWVVLPDYFLAINRDFRYQLTVVDDNDTSDFVFAKVAREIRDNRFKIRTSAPNTKVSWEVKAIRNDRWVREYGAPSEQEKAEQHKGKFVDPELYGQPKDRGIHYMAEMPAKVRRSR